VNKNAHLSLKMTKSQATHLTLIIIIRKLIVTVWFWFGVVFACGLSGVLFCIMYFLQTVIQRKLFSNHDLVTLCIEDVMAIIIYKWMVIPGIWRVYSYAPKGENLPGNDFSVGLSCDMFSRNKSFQKILASNHTSIIDTLFMSLIPVKKSYTYNKKWAWVPVFGWMCVFGDYIGISQSNKSTIVDRVVGRIREGYSVMIYPEGTRSKDPRKLQPMKTGAFRIAMISGVPILPITFHGTVSAVDRYGLADFADIRIAYGEQFQVTDIVSGMKNFEEIIEENLMWFKENPLKEWEVSDS